MVYDEILVNNCIISYGMRGLDRIQNQKGKGGRHIMFDALVLHTKEMIAVESKRMGIHHGIAAEYFFQIVQGQNGVEFIPVHLRKQGLAVKSVAHFFQEGIG